MYGFGPFASAVGAYGAYLGNHLQGAANDVMQAIQNENESRVAQNREMRRMDHESGMMQQRMELERMRLENERARNQMDAANEIRKLKAMMAMQNNSGPRRRSLQVDPLTGQRRWMEDWEM